MKNIICILVLMCIFTQCQKENYPSHDRKFLNGNFSFNRESFQSTYEKIKRELKSNHSSRDLAFGTNSSSLHEFEKRYSSEGMGEIMDNYLSSNQNQSGTSVRQSSADSTVYSVVISELIEDEPLKYLISNQGEIQVGDSIYKISPYGTLNAHVRDKSALQMAFETLLLNNDITIRIFKPANELNYSTLSLRKSDRGGKIIINDVVGFFDTFKEGPNYLLEPFDPEGGSGGGGGNIPPQPDSSDPFANMKVEPVDFRNGFGNVWDTFFINHTKYNYFDSKYRVSVLFYNRDYAIIKTLGLKVKLQKKGWFWWNKTEAEDMIAGWERIVYKQKNPSPLFSLPQGEAPVIYNPYLVNPYDNPIGGWFSQTKAGLFKWHYGKSNHELFSIIIPDFLLPPTENDVTIKSSDLKPLIPVVWNKLKQILVSSVPQAPLGDVATYKFPVHDIVTGETKYYTIAEIEKMTKSIPSAPSIIEQLALGKKIRNYLGPRQDRKQNIDMIDYDLDFSSATISLTYNLASPISVKRVLSSISVSNWDNNFEVEEADVFGTVKHNGKWLGIRLLITVND